MARIEAEVPVDVFGTVEAAGRDKDRAARAVQHRLLEEQANRHRWSGHRLP